jgi:hypothetical protein
MCVLDLDASSPCDRLEYRVWGRQCRARRRLEDLCQASKLEQFDDCYLLVDDRTWNVKVRRHAVKMKHLVAEHDGLQWWTTDVATAAIGMSPISSLIERIRSASIEARRVEELPAALHDETGVDTMLVSKRRRVYRVAGLRAEVSAITMLDTGEVLHSLALEGTDARRLATLRNRLGLADEANIGVHEALRARHSVPVASSVRRVATGASPPAHHHRSAVVQT